MCRSTLACRLRLPTIRTGVQIFEVSFRPKMSERCIASMQGPCLNGEREGGGGGARAKKKQLIISNRCYLYQLQNLVLSDLITD